MCRLSPEIAPKVCNTFHSLSVSIKFFNCSISYDPARCALRSFYVCMCCVCLCVRLSFLVMLVFCAVLVDEHFPRPRQSLSSRHLQRIVRSISRVIPTPQKDSLYIHTYINTVILVTLSVLIEPDAWLLKTR